MIRVNLTYNELEPLPTTLVFDTPSTAVMWEGVQYLHAVSPDQETPITFTSSDNSILKVELKDSFWQMEYAGTGTATVTATQSGQTSIVKTVTVSGKPSPTGRVINVDNSGGGLTISTAALSLLPGDTVIIEAGDYNGVSIRDILITDGQDPVTIITDGLVRVVNENGFTFKNLRNVIVDGCRVPGIKQALLLDGNNYRGINWNNLNNVEIWGVETRDVYDSAWYHDWSGMTWQYNGSDPTTYQKNVKFYNCKSHNSSAFTTNGELNVNNTPKLTGLVVDFHFYGWEVTNTSAGSPFFIGAGQGILFKDCILNHINTTNNNHNGVLFVSGQVDIVNCRLTNFQGNLIRNWPFSINDGSVLDIGPRDCNFYGNIIFTSRKYGAFEGQSFDRYLEAGFTTWCNLNIFNNTTGCMNQNDDPRVFTGTLYDNYDLGEDANGAAVAKVFNNVLIEPWNEGSNNIYLTYNSDAIGGSEHQEGTLWEWNNRVHYFLDDSKINPGSLAPMIGNNGKRRATTNAITAIYTEDIYSNETTLKNIGAVQCDDIPLPASIDPPTVPVISKNILNAGSTSTAASFQIDAEASLSSIGIKNYDIERNGVVRTSYGAYCRDGKSDPSADSDLAPWTAYTWRWRARDWRDQVSDWSEPQTFATEPTTTELDYLTSLTLTKVSGGTLVNTSGVYTATGSAVIANTGVSIAAGQSARLIFDNSVAQGTIGWAMTSTPANEAAIIAGIRTGSNENEIQGMASGVQMNQRGIGSTEIMSLFISYNGDSWAERSSDGGTSWSKIDNMLTSNLFLGANYTGEKHVVVYLPTTRSMSSPAIIHHPTKA